MSRAAGVGRQVADREEERLPRRGALVDRLNRLVGEDVGRVGLRSRRRIRILVERSVGHDLPRLEDAVAVIEVGQLQAVPIRPARRHPDAAALVAVQELADVDRPVAGALQPDGKRVLGVEVAEAALRLLVAEDAVVVGVLPGHVGRPRWAAERPVRDRLRELRAGCADQALRRRHEPHLLERLVVAHQDDDVRGLLGGRREGSEAGGDGCGDDRRDDHAVRPPHVESLPDHAGQPCEHAPRREVAPAR